VGEGKDKKRANKKEVKKEGGNESMQVRGGSGGGSGKERET